MCVDRLEVGLKPACASACLAGALDFGVIETTPDNRYQLETQIPGFPSPEITHPNIRFQQTKRLPRALTRPASVPVRYERDDQGQGGYKTKVNSKRTAKEWNLDQLSSRENPLVLFTLLTQGAVGIFMALFLAAWFGLPGISSQASPLLYSTVLFGAVMAQGVALGLSAMHLGKPHRFYRGFNNLRYSPVSREAAGIVVFMNLLGAYAVVNAVATFAPQWLQWLPGNYINTAQTVLGWGALISGPISIYLMYLAYRIKARPFWDHWQTLTSFMGNTLVLGALVTGLVYGFYLTLNNQSLVALFQWLAWPVLLGLVLEGLGLFMHKRQLVNRGGEGAASIYEQQTRFGKTYQTRNAGIMLAVIVLAGLGVSSPDGWAGLVVWSAVSLLVILTMIAGRALFYVLVIPTTMPGAFFWRNPGFQEHARHSGLANMPQVGVLPDSH